MMHRRKSDRRKAKIIEENWNLDYDKAFTEIKRVLTLSSVLGFAYFSRPFILETEASLQVSCKIGKMNDELLHMRVELCMDLSAIVPTIALQTGTFSCHVGGYRKV